MASSTDTRGLMVLRLSDAPPIAFVVTADRERAMPFYRDILGLPVVGEDDFAVTFALGGGATMRMSTLPGHRGAGHTVLGWVVEDIAAAVTTLGARGAAFLRYDGMGQDADGIWTPPGGTTKVAWFADPDGNVLSLTQF